MVELVHRSIPAYLPCPASASAFPPTSMTSRMMHGGIHSSRLPHPHVAPANRFAAPDSSDDESETEEERRVREEEEEEQERRLSEQFGEASEAPATSSERKRQTDQDIAAEYADATTQPRKKKIRPTLKVKDVIGPNGLIRIQSELPRRMRWKGAANKINKKQAAAAVYAQQLVDAYKSFCYDLFPGLAFADVLTRIESFGSKKELKTYLTHLRDQVRNAHLENMFGKDQAEKMVQELEDGMRYQESNGDFAGQGGVDDAYQGTGEQPMLPIGDSDDEPEPARRISTRASTRSDEKETLAAGTVLPYDSGKDDPATVEGEAEATFLENEDNLQDTDDELEMIGRPSSNKVASTMNRADAVLHDTDDELEAEDDEEQANAIVKIYPENSKGAETAHPESAEDIDVGGQENLKIDREGGHGLALASVVGTSDLTSSMDTSQYSAKDRIDQTCLTASPSKAPIYWSGIDESVDTSSESTGVLGGDKGRKCVATNTEKHPAELNRRDAPPALPPSPTSTTSTTRTPQASFTQSKVVEPTPSHEEGIDMAGRTCTNTFGSESVTREEMDVSPIKDIRFGQDTPDHLTDVLLSEELHAHFTGSSSEASTVIPSQATPQVLLSTSMSKQIESPMAGPVDENPTQDAAGKTISTLMDLSQVQFSPLK